MTQKPFTSQDQCEYIHRDGYYHKSGILSQVRSRFKGLKIYIIITLISIGGGACAVYLPPLLSPSGSGDVSFDKMDKSEILKKLQENPELLEQYKQNTGGR